MSATIKLEALQGPMVGRCFTFDEHDTFVFGRAPDCHVPMPEEDNTVSRHHFLLEVNPPKACVRDFGSLNGTFVNGQRIGRRNKDETPEQGAQRQYPEVELKHGDQITVGATTFVVELSAPAICYDCGAEIPDVRKAGWNWGNNMYICAACRARVEKAGLVQAKPDAIRCARCGKAVAAEIGAGQGGDYVCAACRKQADADPWPALAGFLGKSRAKRNGDPAPAIEGYEIIRQVGVGGAGAVYLARRKNDGGTVAIKVMLARVAVQEVARKRFLKEMEILKSLRHPNVVSLLEQGSLGSAFYFVMEYCDAGSVADLMIRRRGRVPLAEAQGIMLQAADGLAHAHCKGIVHRDLKPGNILLCGNRAQRTVKVSDFGLAKNFERAGFSGLTLTGSYGGTPQFMPREQMLNYKNVKPVSDVWSMAATFYFMLTSYLPREVPKGADPLLAVLTQNAIPIGDRDSSIPKPVGRVIDRALAMQPKDRYADGGELKRALGKALG